MVVGADYWAIRYAKEAGSHIPTIHSLIAARIQKNWESSIWLQPLKSLNMCPTQSIYSIRSKNCANRTDWFCSVLCSQMGISRVRNSSTGGMPRREMGTSVCSRKKASVYLYLKEACIQSAFHRTCMPHFHIFQSGLATWYGYRKVRSLIWTCRGRPRLQKIAGMNLYFRGII